MASNREQLDYTLTACKRCGKAPEEERQMVGCDSCDEWFHYECVGVTDAVKKEDKWFCDGDTCQSAAKEYQKLKKSRTKLTAAQQAEERRKAMEKEQRKLEAEWENEKLIREEQMKLRASLKKKKLLEERELREQERLLDLEIEEESRKLELESRDRELQQKLQAKQEHLKQMQELQQNYQAQMSVVDKKLKRIEAETPPKKMTKVKTHSTPLSDTDENKPSDEAKSDDSGDSDDGGDESDSSGDSRKVVDSDEEKTPGEPSKNKNTSKGLGSKQSRPTKAQLAARHGLNKHLQPFSGKPEDWPLFFAAFTSSTEACGYSDIDNLARLQQCLKGSALELVRGQLLLPKSVPRVIQKLRQHFGRPEQLLQSYLERVKKLEPPKNLRGFIPFSNTVEQLCEHLEAADLKQHLENPLIIKSLVKKFPDAEKRQWAKLTRKRGDRPTTLRTLTDFLAQIAEDACEADVDLDFTLETKASSSQPARKTKEKAALFSHAEGDSPTVSTGIKRRLKPCKVCQRTDHQLRYCQDFKNLTLSDRVAMVTRDKLCKLCLGDHGGQCRFKFRCNVGDCKESHNPLIHSAGAVGISAHILARNQLLFRIIPVQLHCGEKKITVLAFLDEGASVTLIDGRLADQLGIVGTEESLTIKWTADVSRVEKHSRRMNVWISAVENDEKLLLKTVRTVGKLMLPRQRLDANELSARFQHIRGLPLASYEGHPEILIGLNNIHAFAPLEVKVGTTAEPIAVRCRLGWSAYGPKHTDSTLEGGYVSFHHEVSNEEIHDLLKCHYALEESVVAMTKESAENERARKIMERTTKRVGERFETGLLWKEDNPQFPDSRPMALKRLIQLEHKLSRNPELYEKVRQQIADYVTKGYAHLATVQELEQTDPTKTWYLPINVVLNPKKPNKVRLVWDAAAKVLGVSLNSLLLKGPDLLVSLVAVIIGFREKSVAFGGDLMEMFHQLRIIAEDRQAQRFLFRSRPEEEPAVYVMDVATFGATCSPSSAQYVKNRNAEDYASQFPEAAAAIVHRHYVDDYFDSVDTTEEAVIRAKQVDYIHRQAGFRIRNWVSNAPEVLQSLGEESPATAVHFNRDKETATERVLGIIWNSLRDEFSFSTVQREKADMFLRGGQRPTKRDALSCVMGFFDPLGLLSIFTIHGKIILQHLWRKGCNWDEHMDDEGFALWKRWTGLLPQVEEIRIPRCFIGKALSSEIESLEIHIFTDASEHAYGCVAYLRAVINGTVQCSLLMSRAKVAPLKRLSIPRLELMAALLGARLYRSIQGMLSLPVARGVFWTDSRTVCAWLRSDQYKFKQFVAFRIGEILELTRLTDWRWVPTKLNIADALTKWGKGPPLYSESEWFRGPAFLYEPECCWPSAEISSEETNEEARGVVLFHEVLKVETISSWNKLLRVTATMLRFVDNCRRKHQGLPILTAKATTKQLRWLKPGPVSQQSPLQQEELAKAEKALWRQSQWSSFPDELSTLTKNLQLAPGQKAEAIKKRSRIYKCSPILDEDGVLRVDGRLANADKLLYDQKYPVILCRFNDVTRKIIQHYHERFGHANSETVFNEMRQRYEILNLRAAISSVVHECVWCRVHRCVPRAPRMAPLPIQRVTPGLRPFSSVGVDYLGPVEVSVGRRREKRWVAVFTCLTVRAVHLEVVHTLSTQSCLMALRRFESLYGKPDEIFSDNGTCFRGAWNEMAKAKAQIHAECAEQFTSTTTAWRFNPPGTPHMGGVWERMVRSVKEAMKALDDGRKLTDEILKTTVAEASDMINTRPLTYKPQGAGEGALTPNHFLRGVVTNADLQVEPVGSAEALRNMYKRSQYLSNRMWERWITEYLPSINRRPRWFDEQRALEVGDLVFLVDGANRKSWRRGKVVDVFRGADKVIRQANIETADKKVHLRGVVNLAVLEVQDGKSGTFEGTTGCYGLGHVTTAGPDPASGGPPSR